MNKIEKQAITTCTAADIELLTRQAEAQFALTDMGQALKQFEICQRMGAMFAQTSIVPATYRTIDDKGRQNPAAVANCAVAVDMALRMKLPPVLVMQNLYVVHGMPAWSSKFLIGCVNGCGRFTPLEYKMKDNVAQDSDDYGCRCVAYAREDVKKENPLYGPWVTWRMVKQEGWLDKNGSKWRTMPEMMFRYRAAAFWQRLYAPELAMGIYTVDEVNDMRDRRPVDVEYEEVPRPQIQEPAVAEVTDEELAAALELLAAAETPAAIKEMRRDLKKVYDNSEIFRDALIDRYNTLENAAKAAASQEGAALPGTEQ